MAKPHTVRFKDFIIAIGDGQSPETFGAPCGLTGKGIVFVANTSDVNVPDCDDPEAPAWVERDVVSLSSEVSGSGVMDEDFQATWWAWYESATTRNVRISSGDYRYEGAFLLTNFGLNAELGSNGGRVQVDVTAQSSGEVTQSLVSDGV